MNDNDFEGRRVRDALRRYNEPPETPRERIWARIRSERARSRARRESARRRWWTAPRIWVPAAAAAVLVIGISIGRLTAPVSPVDVAGNRTTTQSGPRAAGTGDNTVYRLAATPVLKKAELLLAEFTAGEPPGENGESFSTRAGRLLADTRLLLDSPAADDPELRRVLSDLELVLTQIVRLTDTGEPEDREMIDKNMKNRSLIPRLRATSPTGAFKITT